MDHRWNEPPFLAHPLSYAHYGIAKVTQLQKTQLATGLANHFLNAYIYNEDPLKFVQGGEINGRLIETGNKGK